MVAVVTCAGVLLSVKVTACAPVVAAVNVTFVVPPEVVIVGGVAVPVAPATATPYGGVPPVAVKSKPEARLQFATGVVTVP